MRFDPPRTEQAVFDHVVAHLRRQGRRAERRPTEKNTTLKQMLDPAYLSYDGCKCAAGCLIPDELYDVGFEGLSFAAVLGGYYNKTVSLEFKRKSAALLELYGAFVVLIGHLQRSHDTQHPSQWEREFMRIATQRSLKYTAQRSY